MLSRYYKNLKGENPGLFCEYQTACSLKNCLVQVVYGVDMVKFLCCLPAINRKKRNNTCLGKMTVKCIWKHPNTHVFSSCHLTSHIPFTHIFIFKKHVFGAFHSHITAPVTPHYRFYRQILVAIGDLLMVYRLFLYETSVTFQGNGRGLP